MQIRCKIFKLVCIAELEGGGSVDRLVVYRLDVPESANCRVA
jgi:hypothetical protein